MWTLILLLGLTSAQQQQLLSNEVGVENAGYAVDPNDPNNYYANQYANSAPGTEFYSQYPQEAVQAASDTDRWVLLLSSLGFTSLIIIMALFRITPEIFEGAVSPVVMLVAFASAILGSLLAPLIQVIMNAVADVRVPDILEDIQDQIPSLPRLKRRRKDDNYKKGNPLINIMHQFNSFHKF